ncbi:MAG: hypothetical protein ACE5RP_00105 [Nitrosopumilus sp.]
MKKKYLTILATCILFVLYFSLTVIAIKMFVENVNTIQTNEKSGNIVFFIGSVGLIVISTVTVITGKILWYEIKDKIKKL